MKQKYKARWLWLAVTVAVAALSAALRRWQIGTAFEGDELLPIRHAPASMALACVLVAGAALLLIIAVRQTVVEPTALPGQERRWYLYLLDRRDMVYPCTLAAAAFIALIAAPGLFSQGRQAWLVFQAAAAAGEAKGDNGMLTMITAVATVLSFIGLLQTAYGGYRLAKRAKGGFGAALPTVTGCVWMMTSYRGHAADPVLWDYVPLLLAVVAGMLFYMDYAGMSTDAARPRRLLWLAAMTVVLSAVALATGETQGTALLLISQMLSGLAVLWRLPVNLESPPAPRRHTAAEERTQKRLEETTHE